MQAETLQYSLDEDQWEQDWASILSLAGQPGTSLEQTHVFALAHILRRPVIIYGVKYVKSFRGEVLGLARFQGNFIIIIIIIIIFTFWFFKLHCFHMQILLASFQFHHGIILILMQELFNVHFWTNMFSFQVLYSYLLIFCL